MTFFEVLATSGSDAQGTTRMSLGIGPSDSIVASVTGDGTWKGASLQKIELHEWYRVSARWMFGSEVTVEMPERRNGIPVRIPTTLGGDVVGLSVRVGVQYSQPSGAYQMHLDDVVCDLVP